MAESRKRSKAGASTLSSTPRPTIFKKKKRRYPVRLLNRKMRDRRSVLVAMAILIGESNVNMGAFTDLVGVVIGKGASLSKAGINRMFAMHSYSHFLRYDLGVKSKDALQAFNGWREQQPASHANLRAKFTAPPPNPVLSRRRDDDPNDDPAPLSKRPRTITNYRVHQIFPVFVQIMYTYDSALLSNLYLVIEK